MKKVLLGIIGFIIVVGAIGGAIEEHNGKQEKNTTQVTPSNTPAVTPTSTPMPVPQYKAVDIYHKGNATNVVALIDPKINDKASVNAVAKDAKQLCRDSCNVYVYDDMKALQVDQDYIKNGYLLTTEQDDTWQKQNYSFVASHFVGWIEFESPNTVVYYPFKQEAK